MADMPPLEKLLDPSVVQQGDAVGEMRVPVPALHLESVVRELLRQGWTFVGLVADDPGAGRAVALAYIWRRERAPWLTLDVETGGEEAPSISEMVYAADWPEREVEDLFGVRFHGHPALGNFVLHDERWAENVAPMRTRADSSGPEPHPVPGGDPFSPSIVEAPGSFTFPVGPVFAGVEEAVHLALETVGEEVVYPHVRLFYKYRGVERLMEGRSPADAVLLAERVNGTSAFAHSWAFLRAVESIHAGEVPERAERLRVFWAEFERLRSHIRSLAGIVESTGLSLPANWLTQQEEALLQLAGSTTGHRYLFGLNVLGGLAADSTDRELAEVLSGTEGVVATVQDIYGQLLFDNSFLDRLEEVGLIPRDAAEVVGTVGPVARASGVGRDLRWDRGYGGYGQMPGPAVVEQQGDGYARLRVFRGEMVAASKLMRAAALDLPGGAVRAPLTPRAGTAIGAVEAPAGTLAYWVRMDGQGVIRRCHVMPPNLANWHALPHALRGYAFQDVPIILATFGLSVADADR